jgi:5S rRNA maturation endonuclease (ribonuclease M5)
LTQALNSWVFPLAHDKALKFKKTIFLLDNDAEGRKLLERTRKLLLGRVKMDTFYQRELLPAGKGKIRHVEELQPFADLVSSRVCGL